MNKPLVLTPSGGVGKQMDLTPAQAGWKYLSFSVITLKGGKHEHILYDEETAVVPLSGSATMTLGQETHAVSRSSVFEQLAPVGYAPPGTQILIEAEHEFTFAIGSAPAEGRYPARLIQPSKMRSELRGGGASYRHVNHTLAPPIEAERLILYEVYVPRGTWAGWTPHCHDGEEGSPYLEETYYFRLDRPEGYWMHRNWRDSEDTSLDFEDLLSGGDGDCALVPRGYHTTVACPGSNMYFLNYLAGDLIGEERSTPPCFHSDHEWIEQDWENNDAGRWRLPIVENVDINPSDTTGAQT